MSGNGFIGTFASVSDLEAKFPATKYEGRAAHIESNGDTSEWFSNGTSWAPLALFATDANNNIIGLEGPNGEAAHLGALDRITPSLLGSMGYNAADLAALPLAIKDSASWLVTLRAIDDNRLNNPTNGIDSDLYARDYQGYVGDNVHKWITVESTKGVLNFSRADLVEQQLPVAPTYRALHCITGQNGYNPSWFNTEIGATPSLIGTYLTQHINDLAAKYPNPNHWYRIDVVNEVFNEVSQTSYATDRGFRTTNNAVYTAGLALDANNPLQPIWDAFTLCRTKWPTAKLCVNDFAQETAHPCDSYNRGRLPYQYDTLSKSGSTISATAANAFLTNNDRAAVHQKTGRMLYEIWRAKAAGVPIDVIGYQYHIDVTAPPNWDDMVMSWQNWNRWGVLPAITELNARNHYFSNSAVLPVHVRPSESERADRYAAFIAHGYVQQMLTHTKCEEVTWWSIGYDGSGNGETASHISTDYPIREAVMLAIKAAQAPDSRTIKRGTRINGRFALPLWVTNSAGGGTNLSTSNNRTAITATTSLQMPWTWCNDTWMAMPISASDVILSAQFQIAASIAADTVLMGYGNATSGTPTNGAYLILNGTTLRVDIVVGGVTVLTQNIATGITTATDHRVAVRINGTAVSYTFDGGSVGTATAAGSFSNQTSVYLSSRPDATGFNSNLGVYFWEVHHGADYNSNSLLQGLSTNIIRDVSLGAYMGD